MIARLALLAGLGLSTVVLGTACSTATIESERDKAIPISIVELKIIRRRVVLSILGKGFLILTFFNFLLLSSLKFFHFDSVNNVSITLVFTFRFTWP